MVTAFLGTRAFLNALHALVDQVRMTGAITGVATVQSAITGQDTASVWRKLHKMVWLRDTDRRIRMSGTLELERGAEIAVGLEQLDNLIPHWHVAIGVRVADDIAPVLGS